MDWQRFLEGVGEFAQGAAHGMTINRWSELDDSTAYAQIDQFVSSKTVAEIDEMDSILLATAAAGMASNRGQLVKCYAMFKLAETLRFGQLRGFPQLG